MFRSVTRLSVAIHPEEVRRINHGREHVAGARHADDVLPGMGKIHRPLPRHHPENVQREQHAAGVQLAVSARQKIADHIGAGARRASSSRRHRIFCCAAFTRRAHVGEARIGLVAFGREADIIELDLIGAAGGHKLCQRQVVILHRRIGGIGPHQLAVLPPRLWAFAIGSFQRARRLHRQLGMVRHQMLIAKQRDAGNGMHVHAMQESNELWQIADIWMVNLWRQGMIERHAGQAIAIFNVKDYRVAAQVVPALDKPYPMLAARHQASEINRPDLLIPRHQDRMLDPWAGIILRNN